MTLKRKNIHSGRFLASALLGLCGIAPLMAQATPPANVYGWLGYFKPDFENQTRAGWYKVNTTDGSQTLEWLDMKLGTSGTYFNVGWVREGKVCGYFGNASTMFYLEFDLATGAVVTEELMDVQGDNAFKHLRSGAYNPADDCVYGFALNVDQTLDYFVKAPASDPQNITIVRRIPDNFMMPVSCCFNTADNHMYGVDAYGDLIRIDVNGNFEVAGYFSQMSGETDINIAHFESGMTYSPRDNAFIWNRHDLHFNSYLYKISADKGHAWTKVKELPWQDQFMFFYSPDTDGSETGPEAPSFVSSSFPEGAVSGKVVFKMPSKLADGSDAPASMSWTATDGENTQNGTAAPGAEVTVDYADLAGGEHNFTFRATAGEEQGASLVFNTWIGRDVPAAPENVLLESVDGGYRLSWTAPDHGAHNGYIVPAEIKYAIFLDGKQQGPVTDQCSAMVELPAEAATRRYAFQVRAIGDSEGKLISEAGTSNGIYMGRGYDLPYTIVPDGSDNAAMTIINVENDRSNWNFVNEVGGVGTAFFTSRDWDNKGDDWLITPPLWFGSADATYNVSFEVKFHNELKAEEFFEVWAGNSADVDGIRKVRVAPKTRVNEKSYYTVSYDFKVSEPGTTFVGIHYVGDADQGGIYVRNIKIMSTNAGSSAEMTEGSEANASGFNGFMVLSAPEASQARVYASDGRLVASPEVNGTLSLEAERGLYIVNLCNKTFKVFVK